MPTSASDGAFDARSLCHEVVVPFDQANERVLGGSREPYVNNPLRVPRVSHDYLEARKDKVGWEILIAALDWLEEHPSSENHFLDGILIVVAERLATVAVTYPTPSRIGLGPTIELVGAFLHERSGGDRYEVVATALIRTLSDHFGLFDEVRRGHVNAPDAPTGQLLDLDCLRDGKVVLSVEAKDRDLTVTELEGKIIPTARTAGLKEVIVLTSTLQDNHDESLDAARRIDDAFATGTNIYRFDLLDFAMSFLALLGEEGRIDFLNEVGSALEEHSELVDRQRWAELLAAV